MAENKGTFSRQALTDLANTEWAYIAPGKVIVATEERAWLYQPHSNADPFAQPMTTPGSLATTRRLLDTAIAAAKCAVQSDLRPPALTPIRWIWRLASAYHLTHPVVQLMKDAARGFAKNNRPSLKAWALEKAEEEFGHEQLALKDIQSLGYDAEAVVKVLAPPAAIALMDYFRRSVADSNPLDCVGYSYAMERLSLGVDANYINKVEAMLPVDVNATRCLRVHSGIGADAHHVEENVELIMELPAAERVRIARACYETALMCFSPPSNEYISDEELLQILEPLKLK